MPELHGKGWRTIGYFAWMLGAGIVLDGGSLFWGRTLLLAGAFLFLTGVWQSLSSDVGAVE
jgi:predicted outer membrane lipoprotein